MYFYYSSCQSNVHDVSDIFMYALGHLVVIGLVPGGLKQMLNDTTQTEQHRQSSV